MRFRIEHYRAVDEPGSPLGYTYAPTGRVEEIDAPDEADAAAAALSAEEEALAVDVGFDPGNGLYGVPGEDEAVRVVAVS